MASTTKIQQFAQWIDEELLECRFDEQTGIMHVYLGDLRSDNLPSNAEIMELFAARRRGHPIKGVAIFR